MKIIEEGTKVKYMYLGVEQEGVVHAVKTHETPDGQITRIAYLIDTGETVGHFITGEPTGKVTKDPVTGHKTQEFREVKNRQPEQIEIEQDFVKPVL